MTGRPPVRLDVLDELLGLDVGDRLPSILVPGVRYDQEALKMKPVSLKKRTVCYTII